MVGGAVGFGLLVWMLLGAPLNIPTAVLALLMLAVNALSFVAGVALWSGSRAGRTLSIIIQAIQLPKVVSQQVIFLFSFGLDVWASIAPTAGGGWALGFHFNFLAMSQVFFNAPVGGFALVGMSLSSIVFLALLIRYKGEGEADAGGPPTVPPPPPDWQQSPVRDDGTMDSHEPR
jgi:hypothetical protein